MSSPPVRCTIRPLNPVRIRGSPNSPSSPLPLMNEVFYMGFGFGLWLKCGLKVWFNGFIFLLFNNIYIIIFIIYIDIYIVINKLLNNNNYSYLGTLSVGFDLCTKTRSHQRQEIIFECRITIVKAHSANWRKALQYKASLFKLPANSGELTQAYRMIFYCG